MNSFSLNTKSTPTVEVKLSLDQRDHLAIILHFLGKVLRSVIQCIAWRIIVDMGLETYSFDHWWWTRSRNALRKEDALSHCQPDLCELMVSSLC